MLILAILIAAPYAQIKSHEFINWDDPFYIYNNSMVSAGLSWLGVGWAFVSGTASNWHPLTWISHMLDSSFFGPSAAAAHFVNLFWYIGCVLLAFLLFTRLGASPAAAFFMAAFFGLHPLHVESVAWASERKDLLCAFFFLAATLMYLRYARKNNLSLYLLTTALFILSLLSKPMAVTWPCVVLLLDFWPLQRLHSWKKIIGEKIPWFMLSAASSFITIIVQGNNEAVKSLVDFPLADRLANALVSYAVYIRQSVWPSDLTVFYPYPYSIDIPGVIIACLLLVIITAISIRLREKRPYLLCGWLFYLGVLFPVIGIVQVGAQAHADRYTLLPQLGLILAAGLYLDEILTRVKHRQAAAAVMAFVLIMLAAQTFRQVTFWKDSKTLFYRNLKIAGENELAHFNLGAAYLENNQFDLAVTHFLAAARMNPSEVTTFNNLGVAYLRLHQLSPAEECFKQAILLNPRTAQPHFHLAVIKIRQGLLREAMKELDEAVRLAPEWKEASDLRDKMGKSAPNLPAKKT